MKKEMRLIVKTFIDFFFFALYMWRLKMYRIATSSFLFKRLIENYIRLVRYSVLSVAFIADHICHDDNVLSSFMSVRLNPWVKCLPHSIPVISSM